ncbi:MAG TPA: aminotransferase class III-fold pyridoxal phosphate-dependent enzyme [Gemmatimonadaceae bacterium]|nr:aminotransferase class III-fold pyridoxal phosphate-dependent enzyme [Gemmatimonadaceae bacterium]
MVFSRFFGKSADAQRPADPAPELEEEEAPESELDVSPDEHRELDWAARARRVIPGGASTGSKRPATIYGDPDGSPTHFVQAAGCHVVTADGESLVDISMALGAVALGYAEPQLTRYVMETLAGGAVSGLSHTLEVEVAERFCGVVPCAEKVQFLKSGADAMSAAVRIARTYTGRDIVIGAGYFGWHDWSQEAAGIPNGTREGFVRVAYDDVASLEQAAGAAGNRLAAIAIEPVVERLPSTEWIARARALCTAAGAVLIFDELKTGFRVATGGYQQYADVIPDLAAFGKALANGYPLAAVCGRADLMDASERTWISSTLGSEAGALAAAAAVLQWHEKADVCGSLWSIGKEMRDVVSAALSASGVDGVRIDGIDPMWLLRFEDANLESAFLRAAVDNGVLFKRGAYNYAALAHDEDALRTIESAASAAFVEIREHAHR